MSETPSGDGWNGEMLSTPEAVEVFAAQLRAKLRPFEDLIRHVRRDAEAMWRETPPAEYGPFEARRKQKWMSAPLRDIENALRDAIEATQALPARYRRARVEIPEARRAKGAPTPALGPGAARRTAPPRPAAAPSRPAQPRRAAGRTFLDSLRDDEERSA